MAGADERGIHAYGAYLPLNRFSRAAIADQVMWANPAVKALARGEKAIGNWDEDAITMAVEAGRAVGLDGYRESVAQISFASTSAPFLDRANAGLIGEALRMPLRASIADFGGSLRAGTTAAVRALESDLGTGAALVIAADKRPTRPASAQEMLYGDGGAAVLIGSGAGLARYLGGASLNADLVDHFRTVESVTDYALEERWTRDEGHFKLIPQLIQEFLETHRLTAADFAKVVLPIPLRNARKLVTSCGFPDDSLVEPLYDSAGDTGAAHALLLLAAALEQAEPGQRIMAVGFGQGVDLLAFETTAALNDFRPGRGVSTALARRREERNYLRFLSFNGQIEIDWGLRAERDNRSALSTFYRKREAVTAMMGGICRDCGTAQFPKFRACVSCGAIDSLDDHCFAESLGTVKTFTEDWQAHTPNPPLPYGNIAFDEGGNAFMEITDCEPGALAIGTRVRMVFRIKDFDDKRGFRRYFWKPVPLREED